MFAIINVILPVFALMMFGYLAVRLKLFPQEGTKYLITFVNSFATPCLLFHSMLTVDFRSAFNLSIIAPFYAGALFSLLAGSLVSLYLFKNRPGESVAAGFSATFANTVLVGLPIIQRAYGSDAMPIVLSIIGLHGATLLTVGMLTMELVRRDGAPLGKTLVVAAKRILSNPLIWGIAAGLTGNFLGLTLVEPADAFFSTMGSAVVPVALFSIGGALNEYKLSESWLQALAMSAFKLIVHPVIAYVLMVVVLKVPLDIARYGILLAAMPSGINAYVFATYYNRAIPVATNVVLISTVGSALTLSIWLLILG